MGSIKLYIIWGFKGVCMYALFLSSLAEFLRLFSFKNAVLLGNKIHNWPHLNLSILSL